MSPKEAQQRLTQEKKEAMSYYLGENYSDLPTARKFPDKPPESKSTLGNKHSKTGLKSLASPSIT